MAMDNELVMVGFSLPTLLMDEVVPLLALHCPEGWQEAEGETDDDQTIILYFEHPVDADALLREVTARWPQIHPVTNPLRKEQWASAWKRFFTPIEVGDYFRVLPPWALDEQDDLHPLIINPQMAFGTGHHATTSLCLHALVNLWQQGRLKSGQRFLDAGTGSGILGIACAKLGLAGFGFDLDPLTLENIQENRILNQVNQGFTAFVGTIDSVAANQTFDLIMANILAPPLIAMAPHVVSHTKPDGLVMLSGLLATQITEVTAAYRAQGLVEPDVILDGEWACLLFG